MAQVKPMQLTKRNDPGRMNDKPKTKRPPKRWKRVLKWITGAILVLLLLAFLAGFIAYWRSTNDCGKTGAPTNPMKAIVYCDYGVANLKLEEIEKPDSE